jgi:hypothetical protein
MRVPRALFALALSLSAPPSRGADPAPRRGEVVALRFAWPAALDAAATQRRTRLRTGRPSATTTTRYVQRVSRAEDGYRVATARTRWEGEPPYAGPRDAVDAIVRASESVVQVVSPEGEFVRLDGLDALRPAMERLVAGAELPPDQLARALDAAESAARAQAREAWNLAVGFWTGADLELGERYVMRVEADLPLLPGAKADHDQEFSVRRRVPCSAAERERRCVEITLRATPDPAALERVARELAARVAGPERPGTAGELPRRTVAVENELLLVTEPATLLPHRLVWTRSVRVTTVAPGDADADPEIVEQVDRTESDWRYPAARPVPARGARRNASR